MKDRRVEAFERVLSRRRQGDRKLNAALAGLRGESQALAGALRERRDAADAQRTELRSQDGKIDAMFSGDRFRADDLLMLREYRSYAAERHAALQSQAEQAQRALDAKEAEIAEARAQILRNRARINIYDKRRDALAKSIARAAEDAQDDESAESFRPRAGVSRRLRNEDGRCVLRRGASHPSKF
ncbi:type III secretion system protein [Paraburkholderia sp. SARCC-3016]|uniref:type III secretion system protein n=1 Tax=Paraburkholderia sp. SARCC-3016 TaxID=3058611 RepID=UPI0028080F75|nr:type III secretion system protein [Paraburkholderia sp. SARCC-3016]MDQ7980259.1 type III secretion system protein [Paraburkholderia sp. SARCC-3016]